MDIYWINGRKEGTMDIDSICEDNYDYVFKYLMTLTHNEETARDLTQTTFLKAVQMVDKYNGHCKISTWLCGIAKNVWHQEVDRNHRKGCQPLNDQMIDGHILPDEQVMLSDHQISVMKSIHMLDEEVRELVLLRLMGEFSFAEIGEIMNRSENWCRVTFYRAKIKIREGINL